MTIKLHCDTHFQRAFTASCCVFKVISLVWANQCNYLENVIECKKRTPKTRVTTQLKLLISNVCCRSLSRGFSLTVFFKVYPNFILKKAFWRILYEFKPYFLTTFHSWTFRTLLNQLICFPCLWPFQSFSLSIFVNFFVAKMLNVRTQVATQGLWKFLERGYVRKGQKITEVDYLTVIRDPLSGRGYYLLGC